MENSENETNTVPQEDNQTTTEDNVTSQEDAPAFSDEDKQQMKYFVADKMFESISLGQTLQIAEAECRRQATEKVDAASPEELKTVFNDMQQAIFARQLQQQQAVSSAPMDPELRKKAAEENGADDKEDCCEDKESCEKEECQPTTG